jgi:poly(3-hydroxybutyrate) depolymerase
VAVAAKYTANFASRRYWTRPPKNYDPNKPYTLTIWGQGCGQGNTAEGTPISMNPASADNSVQVELLASQKQTNHCYSAGPDGDAPDSPELPYFDQVVKEVSDAFCIDKSRIFVGGYSSGAWFSGLMGCNRTNVVRGIGLAAGGLQLNHDACTGPVAALITRGTSDNGTPEAQTLALRDSIRMRNGCGTTTKAWTPTWDAGEGMANVSSCVSYDGCMAGYPLIWCPTPGGHTNTLGDTKLTQYAIWKLWSTLP